MRSVNPARGMARKRGSQEALLARGIASARKPSNRLPVIAGTRRLITRSPRSIRLGRIGQHARGKWLALSALFLGSALVYGAVIGGQTTRAYDALTGGIEHLAIAAGFGVTRITVTGKLPCDRRRDHRRAWRRPRHHDARLRHRRRQDPARSRAVDQARPSHAAAALDAASRGRGAHALRRLAEPRPDLCGRYRRRRAGACLARSLSPTCRWSWARAPARMPRNYSIN